MEKLAVLLSILFFSCGKVHANILDFWTVNVLQESEGNALSRLGTKEDTSSFTNLVASHGYYVEEHQVITKDGYILRAHRIPGSRKSPPAAGKPIIYVQHGIYSASVTFVIGGPNQSLVYSLVDAGFDVWLGNARGNIYSRSHKTLSPDTDRRFWKFSFHEIAIYDVSATIDYALNETGKKSLAYIGYSMGTTISLVLLSTKPEYNNKIHVVINLAPVGNWKQPRNFVKFLKDSGSLITSLARASQLTEVAPPSVRFGHIFQNICTTGSALQKMCLNVLRHMAGFEPDVLDYKLFVEAFARNPAGGSAQTFFHFHQNMIAGKLQMYDYGLIGNLVRYRQIAPPAYNLKNVVTPVIMIYGKGDPIAPPEESLDLLGSLKNARVETVSRDNFGHLDFMWTTTFKRLLQQRILEILGEFSGPK